MAISTSLIFAVVPAAALQSAPADPPFHPGASGVLRIQDAVTSFFIDYESRLMSFHGIQTTLADICTGTPPAFDPIDIQLIFSPAGTLHFLATADSHTVHIYPAAIFPDPNHVGPADCPILVGLPLLATGQARMVRTDNDLFGSPAPGSDAFGMSSTGMLDDVVNGGTVGYTETFEAIVFPHTDEVTLINLDIRLNPAVRP
jgi:hypothetical protein